MSSYTSRALRSVLARLSGAGSPTSVASPRGTLTKKQVKAARALYRGKAAKRADSARRNSRYLEAIEWREAVNLSVAVNAQRSMRAGEGGDREDGEIREFYDMISAELDERAVRPAGTRERNRRLRARLERETQGHPLSAPLHAPLTDEYGEIVLREFVQDGALASRLAQGKREEAQKAQDERRQKRQQRRAGGRGSSKASQRQARATAEELEKLREASRTIVVGESATEGDPLAGMMSAAGQDAGSEDVTENMPELGSKEDLGIAMDGLPDLPRAVAEEQELRRERFERAVQKAIDSGLDPLVEVDPQLLVEMAEMTEAGGDGLGDDFDSNENDTDKDDIANDVADEDGHTDLDAAQSPSTEDREDGEGDAFERVMREKRQREEREKREKRRVEMARRAEQTKQKMRGAVDDHGVSAGLPERTAIPDVLKNDVEHLFRMDMERRFFDPVTGQRRPDHRVRRQGLYRSRAWGHLSDGTESFIPRASDRAKFEAKWLRRKWTDRVFSMTPRAIAREAARAAAQRKAVLEQSEEKSSDDEWVSEEEQQKRLARLQRQRLLDSAETDSTLRKQLPRFIELRQQTIGKAR